MKHLSEEQVKSIKTWAKNAKEASEQLNVVLNNIKRQLSKETSSNEVAKAIDANWNDFKGLFMLHMPHIVWNNTKTIVPCDWVEPKENSKLDKAFRAYKYGDEEQSILDLCAGYIVREVEKTKTEIVTFASGYQKEMPSYDAEGNVQKIMVETKLVPREKTAWGYTEPVINAFIAAADDLMETIGK